MSHFMSEGKFDVNFDYSAFSHLNIPVHLWTGDKDNVVKPEAF